MLTFVNRVARAYTDNVTPRELSEMCFVFANKRSGTFFRKALENMSDPRKPRIEPAITTISDFVAELSDSVIASRFELLFTLYNEYKNLSAEVDDFDKFVFWGDMLLSDFNDADMYMADTNNLFRNLKDLKEISADYLTAEQRDVISRYWNMPLPPDNPDRFWAHMHKDGEPRTNRDAFNKLWEILQPLYEAFNRRLQSRGLSYSGRQYREVASRLAPSSDNKPEIPYSRVIFVGFNVLSVSEVKIFERLANMGIADFYWDIPFAEEVDELTHQAATFVKRYNRIFPSLYPIDAPVLKSPQITIVSVPSAVGQVKYAGNLLRKMAADHRIKEPKNAIDTAVVLPAENLFIDLLHSLPQEIEGVNITMGYPLKYTSVAQLIHSVTSMHIRANKVAGQWCFFYEDVVEVLSSPLLTGVVGDDCDTLRTRIEADRIFSIPASYIESVTPALMPVFYPVSDLRDSDAVFNYSLHLVNFLTDLLRQRQDLLEAEKEIIESEKADDDMPEEENPAVLAENLELGFLYAYRRALEQLQAVSKRHNITMRESTFFQLIERTINTETVNFVGEPLQGLQIMGVLETRALTFKNVIMLSMNERIFPQRHMSRSFIPEILRRSYGMCTSDFQECVFAYHFFRLICGAENVTLIYDTRTQGVNSGDMSRYVYQLIYKYPRKKLKLEQAYYDMPMAKPKEETVVKKTPRIMAEINKYRATEGAVKYLSASSINELVGCPLKFYFKHIEQLKVADNIVEYMDESLFGTILHEVAQQSYGRLKPGPDKPVQVTTALLDSLINNTVELQKLITLSINKLFNKLPQLSPSTEPYDNLTPLIGEARVIGNVMQKLMLLLFEEEKKRAPFSFIDAEHPIKHSVKFGDIAVNLTGSIDRIDRLSDNTIAIIDYKTGSDNITIGKLDNLFSCVNDKNGHEKAILQLFIYSNAYSQINGCEGAIQPRLFRFRTLASEGLGNITIEKKPLNNYLDFNEEVTERLAQILSDLFNPNIPFKAVPHHANCQYCKFGQLCGNAK
ncbi:MAG: PD-(D/E)XK nuclease family protein [Muribaculum sp.]|nr:PD-(D/E)XK nuclease family protein [Muribaculaceae bacterium]MCM1081546.1 PD-(D/E)XK nuclease family protein [Muribaculum sp.]